MAFLINPDFDHFNDTDKLCFILNNEKMIPNTARPAIIFLTNDLLLYTTVEK